MFDKSLESFTAFIPFNLMFTLKCFLSCSVFFGVNHAPWHSRFCGPNTAVVMFLKAIDKVFRLSNVICSTSVAFENVDNVHMVLCSSRLWRDPAEGGGKARALPLGHTPKKSESNVPHYDILKQ